MQEQNGLEWVMTTTRLEPRWTREPDIALISQLVRQHFHVPPHARCEATLHAQGLFNKLYKIQLDGVNVLMRVALPVDPHNKTNSEVATINFVRGNTDMPVPRIFDFCADSDKGSLGFEWILMEMLPGQTLGSRWKTMSWDAKRDLVKDVAKYQAQLFRHRFEGIGNLYQEPTPASARPVKNPGISESDIPGASFYLGQIVSFLFFWGNHINQPVPRGPFRTSADWIQSRLTFILHDQEDILLSSDDSVLIQIAKDIKYLAERLLKLLPEIFSDEADDGSVMTVLFHNDLSMQNILVNDDGKITGVIDWECVPTVPLWKACQYPQFLDGRERNEEPEKSRYLTNDAEIDEEIKNGRGNEGLDGLYWKHMMEWELTQLRKTFLEEIKRIEPVWVEGMESSAEKADFGCAVWGCDKVSRTKQISDWLDARERGEKGSLIKEWF